jgi:hypothetical protein
MMKKILPLLFCLGLEPTYAQELNSFQEIYDSVKNGNNISFVINLEACEMKTPVTNFVASISPQAVLLRQNYVVFSNSPITTNNPAFPGRPIMENVTYKLTNADNLNIAVKYFSLPDYTIVGDMSAVCPLKTAVKIYS